MLCRCEPLAAMLAGPRNDLEDPIYLNYSDIPAFPVSTVEGTGLEPGIPWSSRIKTLRYLSKSFNVVVGALREDTPAYILYMYFYNQTTRVIGEPNTSQHRVLVVKAPNSTPACSKIHLQHWPCKQQPSH